MIRAARLICATAAVVLVGLGTASAETATASAQTYKMTTPSHRASPCRTRSSRRSILTDAANIGAVTARTIAFKVRAKDAYFYPDSTWRLPFFGGYKFEAAPGVSNLDGAVFYYYFAIGVTPAMEEKMVGQGSQYPWSVQDAEGNPFDGGKTYKMRLAPNIPVKDFWSVIVYDNQTRSMVQTGQQAPSVSSQNKGVKVNADGSVDVYFGPKAPAGGEQLGTDDCQQGLVHDPSPLWPAGVMVRQDLEAGRDRTGAVMRHLSRPV